MENGMLYVKDIVNNSYVRSSADARRHVNRHKLTCRKCSNR